MDENSLIDLKKENINYVYKNIDRSGWLFQQFLNYACVVKLGMSEYKFCINADTILSKKQTFLKIIKLYSMLATITILITLMQQKKLGIKISPSFPLPVIICYIEDLLWRACIKL